MNSSENKVIDVIEKAISANLTIKNEIALKLLTDLMVVCQESIGEACLTNNSPEVAEKMRQFYQDMSPIIRALKGEQAATENFLQTAIGKLETRNFF